MSYWDTDSYFQSCVVNIVDEVCLTNFKSFNLHVSDNRSEDLILIFSNESFASLFICLVFLIVFLAQ